MVMGCGSQQEITKLRDVEYTVVPREDLPEELATQIAERQTEEFCLSYEDGAYLYLVRGYGTQPTAGYSISVEGLYLTDQGLIFVTEMTGPQEGQEMAQKETTPFVVVKTETIDAQVLYR
jgi:hypothetical protein